MQRHTYQSHGSCIWKDSQAAIGCPRSAQELTKVIPYKAAALYFSDAEKTVNADIMTAFVCGKQY